MLAGLSIPQKKPKNCKIIVKDLRKQQAFDTDPKAIQQMFVTGNLKRVRNTQMFFILTEVKETIMVITQGTMRVL